MPVICIAGAVAAHYLFHPLGRLESTYFFVPALMLFLTGYVLDRKREANDFYFIPMKYWALFVAIFGIVILVTG
jgi:hypothetical protein